MRTKISFIFSLFFALCMTLGTISAQTTYKATIPQKEKAPAIMLSYNNLMANYLDTIICVEVASNIDFTVTPKVDWLKVVKFENNYLYLKAAENETDVLRSGTVELKQTGGTYTNLFQISQAKNNAANSIKGDIKLKVASGSATTSESGEGIEKSFDGDYTTMYHSSWAGGTLPETLTYNFTGVDKIDYMIYNPRRSGGSNGNFGDIDVYYKLSGASDYVLFNSYSLNQSGNPFQIDFAGGLVNPVSIRVVVKTGLGGFASCSEMEFFKKNDSANSAFNIFTDNLCTALKPEVTADQINNCINPLARKLAKAIKAGTYSTEFRVNEFEAYPTLNETASWMRTSNYDSFENPTGIYFQAGDAIAVFVDNPGTESLILKIQNQVPGESGSSSYTLKNGVNKIIAGNKGQAYLSYYTTNWKTAPKVKVHFAFATVTGYFDLEKYKTADGYDRTTAAADWKRILAGAVSPMFDVISKRHHTCYPTEGFRKYYLNDGVDFALAYDSIVYREHEVMGLLKKEPKNHQYTRSVASGMFADGLGAGIPNATSYGYMNVKDIDWWGIAHELGHVNQVRPAMKWVGTTEVTNNLYSAYVQHKLGNGSWVKSLGGTSFYRLEDEVHGGADITNGAGGRFNAYLNYGIKDGGKWLMTEGPDYFGSTPSGNPATRNYDHFVKLAPLWQLLLYFEEAGVRPGFYPQMFEMARTINTSGMSDGDMQLNFMKSAIDSTKLDLTDFFDKCGMLREYNDYISDYSNAWMNITKTQCDDLKTYASKYSKPESPVIYYISAKNWEIYRDKRPLEVEYVAGKDSLAKNCLFSSNSVRITHYSGSSTYDNVKNVVAFETYDADNKLIRITMRGFKNTQNRYTYVLYPKGSVRIDAVGWDGTRKVVYNVPNL